MKPGQREIERDKNVEPRVRFHVRTAGIIPVVDFKRVFPRLHTEKKHAQKNGHSS
jgi:hypothetical protein